MLVMIEYDDQDFEKIQQYFPNLFYDKQNNRVRGELDFSACYIEKIKKNKRTAWEIVPCSSGKGCIQDCYEIEILLNNQNNNQDQLPKIFEIGGRIENFALKGSRDKADLHLYPDNSCCLGINISTTADITLSDFILNKIYPYFVWQAYFDKYERIPPCGEYSHGDLGVTEFEKERKKLDRNGPCICGSGKKYKKCCQSKSDIKLLIDNDKTIN